MTTFSAIYNPDDNEIDLTPGMEVVFIIGEITFRAVVTDTHRRDDGSIDFNIGEVIQA